MSLPRRAALRPLLAVLCACACLVAMFLIAQAGPESIDSSSPIAEIGDTSSAAAAVDAGDEDEALQLPDAPAHPRARVHTPFASAPRAVTAGTDPPQSPPPEA